MGIFGLWSCDDDDDDDVIDGASAYVCAFPGSRSCVCLGCLGAARTELGRELRPMYVPCMCIQ